MADTMQFDLVSPERSLASVPVREVRLPGTDGDLTVMPGEIVGHGRDKKVIAFKKRRRHNYRRRNGHRQQHTILKITAIGNSAGVILPKELLARLRVDLARHGVDVPIAADDLASWVTMHRRAEGSAAETETAAPAEGDQPKAVAPKDVVATQSTPTLGYAALGVGGGIGLILLAVAAIVFARRKRMRRRLGEP